MGVMALSMLGKELDDSRHIVGQRGLKLHEFPVSGMDEAQTFRMQGLSFQRPDPVPDLGILYPFKPFAPPIFGIPHDGMSSRRQMGSNLMGSACFGYDFQQCKPLESLNHPPLRDSAPRLVGVDGDPLSLLGMSSEGRFNDPLGFPHVPMDQCDVVFFYLAGLKLGR